MLWLLRPTIGLANGRGWELEPYRIRALLAIDVEGGLSERLMAELPDHLRQRVEASIGPAWSLEVTLLTGVTRHAVTKAAVAEGPPATSVDSGLKVDKLLLLTVRSTPTGYELSAREFDHYVQLWSPPLHRTSRQADELGEQLFALAWQAVRPLARLELVPGNEKLVELLPRGIDLYRLSGDARPIRSGDVLLPISRRTLRGGELAEGGLQTVPWTYLEAAPAQRDTDQAKLEALVHSANRQPFGVRRQGRVEQLAIAVRADPAETTLRLRSRTNPEKPLIGYDVFLQGPDRKSGSLAGASDSSGRVTVPPTNAAVQMLMIKHGGQLLARLPVAPGAEREIDVPLPDDDVRLAAEARFAALREDLIDVVARRNILMARVRQKIDQDDFAAAQELMRTLDELPGRSQFQLTLTTSARLLRSDDEQMQRRIDQLIQALEAVVAQFLDTRVISQLHDDLRSAQAEKNGTGS